MSGSRAQLHLDDAVHCRPSQTEGHFLRLSIHVQHSVDFTQCEFTHVSDNTGPITPDLNMWFLWSDLKWTALSSGVNTLRFRSDHTRPHSEVLTYFFSSCWFVCNHGHNINTDKHIMIHTFLKLVKSFFTAAQDSFRLCWLVSPYLSLARFNTQTHTGSDIGHMCKLRLGQNNIVWSELTTTKTISVRLSVFVPYTFYSPLYELTWKGISRVSVNIL